MNEFWTTILNSPVIASLAECALLCGVILLLQHIYNKKLEEHKAEVQKKIDEHQTRFNWWYQEKAKAVKEFYYSTVILCREMRDFHVVIQNAKNNSSATVEDFKKRADRIIQLNISSYRDWKCLQLFLEDKYLEIADPFFLKSGSIFEFFFNQMTQKDFTPNKEKINEEIKKMSIIVEELRKQMREILKIQEVNS